MAGLRNSRRPALQISDLEIRGTNRQPAAHSEEGVFLQDACDRLSSWQQLRFCEHPNVKKYETKGEYVTMEII
ncbi:hypothetical protein EJB05_33628, partial [Eragrostis curvula]